ncbi:14393_t:CDS:2 [Ambispora leptoticha]|uniref:14393_t:CDS:1 n=1 Tax=Ambispora leptoticha TaxID=144679 RepID=A0A9N8ZMZ5_9GLOM|nr:14393_t:CDS:2 [Ambispora leptoticha]
MKSINTSKRNLLVNVGKTEAWITGIVPRGEERVGTTRDLLFGAKEDVARCLRFRRDRSTEVCEVLTVKLPSVPNVTTLQSIFQLSFLDKLPVIGDFWRRHVTLSHRSDSQKRHPVLPGKAWFQPSSYNVSQREEKALQSEFDVACEELRSNRSRTLLPLTDWLNLTIQVDRLLAIRAITNIIRIMITIKDTLSTNIYELAWHKRRLMHAKDLPSVKKGLYKVTLETPGFHHLPQTEDEDIRWPNILRTVDGKYVLIDFDHSDLANEIPQFESLTGWDTNTLELGKYTRSSDMYQVGKLFTINGESVIVSEIGRRFMANLQNADHNARMTAKAALLHEWITRAQ